MSRHDPEQVMTTWGAGCGAASTEVDFTNANEGLGHFAEVDTIAVSPADPNRMLVRNGAGVYWSDDGVSRAPDRPRTRGDDDNSALGCFSFQQYGYRMIVFDPSDPNRVYYACFTLVPKR